MSASDDLANAATAVRDAVALLRSTRPTMERFIKECRDMESFGPMLAPALFLDRRREKMSRAVEPMFCAAIALLDAHSEASQILIDTAIEEKMKEGGT